MAWTTCLLTVLMLATVLCPQSGYIHPDEFFQSTEIVAGDVFNITHLRTWEYYNMGLPIRDIAIPYLLYAPGYYAVKALKEHFLPTDFSSLSSLLSYLILVIPRLVIVCVGFVNVCCVKKLCRYFSVDENKAVWYWATSFAVWTFLTRSFSNSIETALFSLTVFLLLSTEECHSKILSWKNSNGNAKESLQDDAKKSYRKLKFHSFLVGFIACLGIFNRPTFAIFVFVPCMWWLERISSKGFFKRENFVSLYMIISGAIVGFVAMTFVNSAYYNPEFLHVLNDIYLAVLQQNWDVALEHVSLLLSAVKIPPWNFILFNMSPNNLAQHGLHPWFTHLLVNIPLILGPLVLLIFWDFLKLLRYFRKKDPSDVLYGMVFIPAILLSFFPHQEARFLLPVLPVAVVCAAKNSLSSWKTFKTFALLFNVLMFVAFGWLHQGGVIKAMSNFQDFVALESKHSGNVRVHLLSYSSYMLPRHLLFHEKSSKAVVVVEDFVAGQNKPLELLAKVKELKSGCHCRNSKCSFYILASAPAVKDLQTVRGLKIKEKAEYFPHISSERLPVGVSFDALLTAEGWSRLLTQLSLKLLLVSV